MRSVLLLAVLTVGCAAELDEGGEEDEVGTSSRVALNGLTSSTPDSLTSDFSLFPQVAGGSLPTASARVPRLFSSAKGREQFSYLVSCAEKPDRTVVLTVSGVTYTFAGSMALAPEWSSGALSASKYKLVTACILARTNYFGISVPISMRSRTLTTSDAEAAAFTIAEGAFWGDLFTAGMPPRACASLAKLSGEAISTLPQRECTTSLDGVSTLCGFDYAGECSMVCAADLTKKFGYTDCEGTTETITVFVQKP